jgi:hypothetical protein
MHFEPGMFNRPPHHAANGVLVVDNENFFCHEAPPVAYILSNIAAIPWPPPMHMVTNA